MTVSIPDQFQGFAVDSSENWNKPKLVSYKRKQINPHDVVIKNICCGLCGSDIHTLSGAWTPLKRSDAVVGHEIIGNVIAVGDDVTEFKIGDRVGIVATYNAIDTSSDNYVTQGGYSSHSIANEKFVFAIPEALESTVAAPLMCAGLTVYSPLVRNVGTNAKGKTVGIVGIGGLGHLAIQFAAALGAEVYAFSRSSSKKEEAQKMGATHFIATAEEKNWTEKYHDKFDFILNCASGADLSVTSFFDVLKVDAKFISVGLPPAHETFSISPFSLIRNAGSFGASLLGSKKEALDMLQLAADKGVKPWIEEVPISEEGCNSALTRCDSGDVRYRFVFTEFDKAFN